MATHTHGVVKIVVGDVNVVAPHPLGDVQMPRICRREARFRIFAPKEIYCVDVAILLRQVREVSLKSWLRRLRARNLNSLVKCLQPLLLPED
jgi:hypothetical protein